MASKAFDLAVLLTLVDRLTGPLQRGPMRALQGLERQSTMVRTGLDQMMSGGALIGTAAALAAPLGYALQQGIDLNETINQVDRLFKSSSVTMKNWAQNSAEDFGLSRLEALNAIASFGNLFLTMGLGQKKTVDMSQTLVKLSADMASFKNTSLQDALYAIQAGLIGETEPLRRYGVLLTETLIKHKAFDMGLTSKRNSESALLPHIKTQAAYQLILEQTKNMQNDWKLTIDQSANQTRLFGAQLRDIAGLVGTQIEPDFRRLMHTVTAFTARVLDWAQANPQLLKQLARAVTLVTSLMVVIGLAKIATGAFNMTIGSAWGQLISLAMRADRAVGAVNRLIWAVATRSPAFAMMSANQALMGTIPLTMRLQYAWQGLGVAMRSGVSAAFAFARALMVNPIFWIITGLVLFVTWLVYAWNTAKDFRNNILAALSPLVTAFRRLWSTVLQALDALGPVGAAFRWLVGVIASAFQNIDQLMYYLGYGIGFFLGFITTAFVLVFTFILTKVTNVFNGILKVVTGFVNIVVGVFTGDITKITTGTRQVLDGVRILWKELIAWLEGLLTRFVDIGVNIVKGIWTGIQKRATQFWEDIKGFGNKVVDFFNGIFVIKSPSRVFATMGGQLMAGLAQGITENTTKVTSASRTAALAAISAGAVTLPSASATAAAAVAPNAIQVAPIQAKADQKPALPPVGSTASGSGGGVTIHIGTLMLPDVKDADGFVASLQKLMEAYRG